MLKKIVIPFLAVLILAFSYGAQWGFGGGSLALKSGKLDVLKSEKEVNVQYDYSKMAVGKCKTEKEYVDKKVKEYNAKEKGKGDKWKEAWIDAREKMFQPKFEELANKKLSDLGMQLVPNSTSATYTIIVKTTFTEPGYNIGIARENAAVSFEILLVETANPTKKIAAMTIEKAPGASFSGMDFDSGSRISEAYAKAGKSLGAYIVKAMGK